MQKKFTYALAFLTLLFLSACTSGGFAQTSVTTQPPNTLAPTEGSGTPSTALTQNTPITFNTPLPQNTPTSNLHLIRIAASQDFVVLATSNQRVITARVDVNGKLIFLKTIDNIGSWSHIVATNDTFFFYNVDARSGLVARIGPDGSLNTLKTYAPGNVQAITHLVATKDRVFAYNSMNNSGTVFKFEADGAITNLKSYPPGNVQALTDFVATDNIVFGYNHDTRSGTVFKIETDGTITNLKSYAPGNVQDLMGGYYTTAFAATSDRVFAYNYYARSGTVFKFEADGAITNLKSYPPGNVQQLTQYAATADRLIYFNNFTQIGGVSRIDPDGSIVNLSTF